ncbi:MAG: phage integrase N-terminal SAM-like domain-containing protein, partial [Cyanobacteria bacterium J06649_11]
MKATVIEKNGLDQVLTRMSERMALANYAKSTIASYCRLVRTLGIKIGKSLVNVEEDELHEYLLSLKDRMSQSSWHTVLYGIKYCYVEVLDMPELVTSLPWVIYV